MTTRLEQIKQQAEQATKGPWKVWGMQVLADPVGDSNLDTALPIADTTDPHRGLRTFNANFIASARTDVPNLVAALEAVAAVHNSDGLRWVGFPRADQQVAYCTHCQHRAPCPTVQAIEATLQ